MDKLFLTCMLMGQIFPIANRENEALALAVPDVKTLSDYDRRYTRYVWISDGNGQSLQINSLVTNYFNQEPVIKRPVRVVGDKALLARINLSYLASGAALEKLLVDWEEFRFDPRFNLLLTKDTIRFSADIGYTVKKEWKLIDVPVYVEDGKAYNQKWIQVDVDFSKQDVVRVVGEHLDRGLIAELIDATGSQAPIVDHRYFLFRAMSSIKDSGLYAVLFGGLYYDLAGVPQKSKIGTDKDNLLELLGVGTVKGEVRARELFAKLKSDQRTAVFKSGVTGSTRAMLYLRTLAGQESMNIVVFTLDVKRESIDIGQNAMMNLIDFKADGSEAIFEKSNGLQGFAIYDGKDKLLQAVASNIACDRTVPAPHSTDLQAPISCIRCHGPEGGWRISRNDVKKLVGGNFDILADRNIHGDDVFKRLAGLYSGDLEMKVLPRARDDYASAVLKATGIWKESKDQTDIIKLTSARIGKMYSDYAYSTVDAKTVLFDLGVKVKYSDAGQKDSVKREEQERKEAADILDKLLTPVPIVGGYSLAEDPRIKALTRGMEINNIADYALTYAFIARRVQLSSVQKK